MQGPGGPDEDTSGGFKFRRMVGRHFDDTVGKVMGGQMGHRFDLLLGRRTYGIFAGFWPKQNDETAHAINSATKYVVSHRPVSLDWKTTVLLNGDVVEQIKKLKAENGSELRVHGSGNLIQTLLIHDLVDELWLKTFPVVLGTGKHLFADGTMPGGWQLLDSQVSPSGVIVATYGGLGR